MKCMICTSSSRRSTLTSTSSVFLGFCRFSPASCLWITCTSSMTGSSMRNGPSFTKPASPSSSTTSLPSSSSTNQETSSRSFLRPTRPRTSTTGRTSCPSRAASVSDPFSIVLRVDDSYVIVNYNGSDYSSVISAQRERPRHALRNQ